MALTDEQIERYSRHIILKEVGAKGQKKLLNAKVLIIGAGGLGAPAAMYLGAAGVYFFMYRFITGICCKGKSVFTIYATNNNNSNVRTPNNKNIF